MDGPGLMLPLAEAEIEGWIATLRWAAAVLTLNRDEVPAFIPQRLKERLCEMALKIECQIVRQAVWDAVLVGDPGFTCQSCGVDCLIDDAWTREVPYCVRCARERKRLVTLPTEW